MTILTRDACQYTKQYCEENIYLLAKQLLAVKPESKTSVVFISNKRRAVPLWGQAASKDDSTLVVWDYHVILIEYTSSGCMVYDFDAILPFPCSWNEYMSMVFRPDITLAEDFQRQFRVVSAIDYIGHFSSDRSHMLDVVTQTWLAPPPSYPPLINSARNDADADADDNNAGKSNLDAYIDMNNDIALHYFGKVYQETEFYELLSK